MVVHAMEQGISIDDQGRRPSVGLDGRLRERREIEANMRSGNAIVGVAVSALLWVMLALLLLAVFAR
jgi:hypothetical protein